MLKIAMVAEHASLRPHDAEQRVPQLAGLADALTAAGHEVTVYVREGHESASTVSRDSTGARVVRMTGRFGPALAERLRADPPHVVHVHCGTSWSAAAQAARARAIPVVFSLHSPDDGPCIEAHPAADTTAARDADHVLTAYSAQTLALVHDGVPRRRTSVVPYGVDVDHFTPDGEPAPPGRYANRIVVLGSLSPRSGFGTAVAALRALRDTELLIVGGPHRGRHAHELRDYARSLGVARQVHLAGPIARTEIPGLLRSADILVCCPWQTTFGVPALEGMACGVTVVANRLGGLTDTVVDNVTGVHVTPHKPQELAANLQRLLLHKALCEQLGAAGRDRVWARYSWPQIAADTVHAYARAGAADPKVAAMREAAAARRKEKPTIATA